MLMPKRTKYRRPHRLSYEGRAKAGREVSFGEYGLMADTGAYVSNRQIEAARIAMTRYMKRGGKVWIRIFPHLARTKKPLEVRMGSGKGAPEGWVAVVKPGRMTVSYTHLDVYKRQSKRHGKRSIIIAAKISEYVSCALVFLR